MIGGLIDGAIKRRKVVLGVTVVAAIFGFFAYIAMPREAQPNIDVPYIIVVVPFPGVSPEDAERLLLKPMELELQTIQGLEKMSSVARQNSAVVTLEFEPDIKTDLALADVRAQIDLARGKFPPDAEEPIIQKANFTQDAVIRIMLYGPAPERELFLVAQRLKDRLEATEGVLDIFMGGVREELLEVTVDPLRMEAYGVTTGEISQVIGRNNQ